PIFQGRPAVTARRWGSAPSRSPVAIKVTAALYTRDKARSTDTQPNQTDIKTERKASLCSSAVQFVLTLSVALSSLLILMSSPGIRFRRPVSQ
ncbi:hypothetical protein FQN60_006836, partial [Etheostoma spectabile]